MVVYKSIISRYYWRYNGPLYLNMFLAWHKANDPSTWRNPRATSLHSARAQAYHRRCSQPDMCNNLSFEGWLVPQLLGHVLFLAHWYVPSTLQATNSWRLSSRMVRWSHSAYHYYLPQLACSVRGPLQLHVYVDYSLINPYLYHQLITNTLFIIKVLISSLSTFFKYIYLSTKSIFFYQFLPIALSL